MIYVGTSGWQYTSWRERFYPRKLPQAAWLEFFAARFSTVEINNSFYMLPEPHTFDRWRDRVPRDFVYAVKGNRYITHIKRMIDASEPVATFWERASRLRHTLGPVLWQFPPSFKLNIERLETFLSLLPPQMLSAFEFRHDSWVNDDVHAMLDRSGAALVMADRPGARVPPTLTGGWAYIRFHEGRPGVSDYPRAKLRRWADRIATMPARDVYVYFNNDPGGAAIRDAFTLIDMLLERGMHVHRPQNALAAPDLPAPQLPIGL